MKEMSKKIAQAHHARKRGLERYGISFNKHVRRTVIQFIQSGKATFIERQSLRITIWDVPLAGKTVRVVYDTKRHSIVTVLPREDS